MRIRQSELTKFQRCPRSWYFQYQLGLRTTPGDGPRLPASGQRDVGTAFHAGAEATHLGRGFAQAQLAIYTKVDELRAIRNPAELPPIDLDADWSPIAKMALTMLDSYNEWLEDTGADSGFETLAVEMPWEVHVPGHDFMIFGTIDLVGRDYVRGGIVIDDVKTVKDLSPVHPADFQLRTYAWAWWRLTGEVPVGAGHRQVRRVGRSARSKPPYAAYSAIHISEELLVRHERHIVMRAGQMFRVQQELLKSFAEVSDVVYPVPSKDCAWDCDFKSLCSGMDYGDDWESIVELQYTKKEEAPL